MALNIKKTDWNSSTKLLEIIKNIEAPLASIIEENNKKIVKLHYSDRLKDTSTDIIFSNSLEIQRIIDEIVYLAKGENAKEEEPIIFKIYHNNERVQSMCEKKLNPKRISKQDTSWLLKMENEIYKSIDQKNLNLYDLSYNLSVSERQLHRKIKNLIHLTPNKYIRVLKLHKAKEIIDNYLYDTISQISYAVGYYDTHYFSKLFNKQYGSTPKELLNNTQY